MYPLVDWGLDMVLWAQDLGSWLETPMRAVSWLGTVDALVIVMPVILWSIDASLGRRVGVVLLTYGSVNTMAKVAFAQPRPYWVSDQVQALSTETSFGIPSGHAGFSTATYGRLALGLRLPVVRALLVLLILAVSFSRIYLGVHWPADVLAGWALGLGVLLLTVRLEEPAAAWARTRPLRDVVLASLALSLVLLAAVWTVVTLRAAPVPEAWQTAAAAAASEGEPLDPSSMIGTFTATGALFGFLAGMARRDRLGGYSAGGAPGQRVLRYLVGASALLGAVVVFRLIIPEGASWEGPATYVEFTLIGWWVSDLAPATFQRLGIASRPPTSVSATAPHR